MAGVVSGLFEELWISDFTFAEVRWARAGEVTPDAVSIRGPSGQNCRARRGADSAGRVALHQLNPLGSQPVHIGCLNEVVPVGGGVPPTHVIYQKNDNVGLFGGRECLKKEG